MFKVDKKLILVLILVLGIGILAGCSSQQKAPEGVSQDFYDDMVSCLKKITKHRDNDEKNGIDIVKEYKENKLWLNATEKEIIGAVSDMYLWVWLYYNGENPDRMIVRDTIVTVNNLMDIDIDIDKIVPKK